MPTRRAYLALFLIAPLVVYSAVPLPAQSAAPGTRDKPIDVTADSLRVEESGARVEAKGNVEVRREESLLKADEVRVNQTTQEVEAKGNVSFTDPQARLKADAARLNLEKETGEIENGDLFFEQRHLTLSGKRLQKFAGQSYQIDEGLFTTCLCEAGAPHWKIGAKEVDLTPEGNAIVYGGTFYILDVPVLYLPYAFFPARTERQTGFLFPKIGSSNKEGFRFQQPFFWAISRSSDATLAVDVESQARIGALGEARTLFSREAQAQMHLSYFNEDLRKDKDRKIGDPTIADPEIPKDRWSVIAAHRHSFAGWTTYSDVFAFSDDIFTRELVERFDLSRSEEAALGPSRYGRSRFGFFRSWGDAHFKGEWDFYQDFVQDDAGTLQKTPRISLWGRRPLGKTPLEIRWRGDAVNYLRREGGDGVRLDLRPELVLPFRLRSYLFGALSLAPRETLYHLYQAERTDRNLSRELVEVRGNLGTSIGRTFAWRGEDLQGIKHVVEPEVSYLFVPRADQADIPIMDGVDRVNRRNLLTFSLTNRLWGKYGMPAAPGREEQDVELLNAPPPSDVREMGKLRLALSYDVDRERKGGDTLSDLDMNLRLAPLPYLSLGVDTGLNPGPWQVSQAAAVLGVADPRPITRRVLDPDFMRPNSLSVSYRFLRKGPNSLLAENANIDLDMAPTCPNALDPRCTGFDKNLLGEVGGSLLFRLTDHLLFHLASVFNTRDSRSTSHRGAIKILSWCECWTVTLSLTTSTNPSKTSFNFDFNLLGLGSQKSSLR